MRPEDVAAEAGARARSAGYEDLSGFGVESGEDLTLEALQRWALIEVDPEETVYSTRRLGAPITALKRGLVRMLRQYLNEATSQQTRFNVHLLAYVAALEDRVAALEAKETGDAVPREPR
jgi:hypothetical protein